MRETIRTSSRAERKLVRSLHRRKGRSASGLFLAEGVRVVEELLASPVAIEFILAAPVPPEPVANERTASDARLRELLHRAEAAGMDLSTIDADAQRELATTVTPQGILAVARIPVWSWSELDLARLLVLDAVQDPGNLGTLVRTAEAMGLGAVICLPGTVDPWSPKAVRAAAGSSFRVPVLCAPWEETEGQLSAAGVALWAADPGGDPIRRGDPRPDKLALVLGNEGRGISDAVLGVADRRVALPLAGRLESLNVGVAGAILMDRLFGEDVMDRTFGEDDGAR